METKEYVREAAKLMDDVKPGWHENINFKTLTMHQPRNCIAGQNGLAYASLQKELDTRLGKTNSWDNRVPFGGSGSLVPFWKDEVQARLGKVRLRDKVMLALSACLPF